MGWTFDLMSKAQWVSDVMAALAELGGEGHLSDIYEVVFRDRDKRGDPLGEYEAWVRNALQSHSRGKGYNFFEHVGPPRSGRWRLRGGGKGVIAPT